MPIALIIIVLIAVFFALRFVWLQLKRRRLLRSRLSGAERAIVARMVPLTQKLPHRLRPRLEGKINLFLDQVDIKGVKGLEITPEIRLSIAAQACLIVVAQRWWYKTLGTIYVLPRAYRARDISYDGYVVTTTTRHNLGESWQYGPVVLSWADAAQGGINPEDGMNLVIHEFAHQLDSLSGATNGVPLLPKGQRFAQWEEVFLEAYTRHVADVARGKRTFIDDYGATNHAEFFAVTMEVFFEKPAQLRAEEPAFYAQFSRLLNLDPAAW